MAEEEDIPQLVEIENREILEGTAHFGTDPVSLSDARAEFDLRKERYPIWCATEGSEIHGFARSGPWKKREAYRNTAEVGVYVKPAHQGQGVAWQLYSRFIPSLRDAGFRTIIAGIALPNPSSIRLHERFEFRHVGTLPLVGYKFDQWLDVGYWVLNFPPSGDGP